MTKPTIMRLQGGLSLIELMIAMAIGLILLLGIGQIFVASKTAYQVQNGLARAQENSRFSMSYFERNVRLAGYLGCGSDLSRVPPNDPTDPNYPYTTRLINHLVAFGSTPDASVRFQRPLEGFHYTGPSVAGLAPAVGGSGQWTPSLPAGGGTGKADLNNKVVRGTDVLILRIIGEQSTPVLGTFLNSGTFSVADASFVKANGVYAIENCGATPTYGFTEIFTPSVGGAAITAALDAKNVLKVPSAPSLTWNHGIGFSLPVGNPMNASVHEAQYLAIYVGLRDDGGGVKTPSLFVQHFKSDGTFADDELADNVESLQLQFGSDTTVPRDDTVDVFQTADQVIAGATTPELQDAAWQKVISVRVGVLARGPDSNTGETAPATYRVVGVAVSPQTDKRVRQVYETTVSLRNRIFSS